METKSQKNSQNVRLIENDVLIPVLREIVESGQEVRMTVSGSSMLPLIHHGRDSVLLKAPQRPPEKGDIVFYQRDNGQYVLHRILKKDDKGNIYCVGDAQVVVEGPLREDQVFAVVTAVNRDGQWIRPGSLKWWFFSTVWLKLRPFRHVIMSLYSRSVGKYKTKHLIKQQAGQRHDQGNGSK